MVQGKPPLVAGHQHKSRAAHVTLNAQTARQPLRQASLARPQRPAKQVNIARPRPPPDNFAQTLRLFRPAGTQDQRRGRKFALGHIAPAPPRQ